MKDMTKYEKYYKSGDTRMSPVYLPEELYTFLDKAVYKMKQQGFRGISRTKFIKAIIQAEYEKERPYKQIDDEQELINYLKT